MMKPRILWLCSWYPNEAGPFEGDFIQRQAEAVSGYYPVDVLYVHNDRAPKGTPSFQHTQRNEQMAEYRYLNPGCGRTMVHKAWQLLRYIRIHFRFIRKHGRPQLIHVQVPFRAGLIALLCKWRWGIPYVVSEHYGIYNEAIQDHFITRSWFFRRLTRLVIRHADALTTVSKSLGEEINHWVIPKAVAIIPNVVDTRSFRYTPIQSTEPFRFLHISNMVPLKNVEGIIKAAIELSKSRNDFCLHLVGGIQDHLHQLAAEASLLDRVILFEGVVAYEEVAKRMASSNALIIFSDSESQSCVVLESLCTGRPAIVTKVGGVKELIDEHNGILVRARDTGGLVKAMCDLIDRYHTYDLKAISETACARYNYQEVGRQFAELYRQVLPSLS